MSPVRLANFLDLADRFPEPHRSRIRFALRAKQDVQFIVGTSYRQNDTGKMIPVARHLVAEVDGRAVAAVDHRDYPEVVTPARNTA